MKVGFASRWSPLDKRAWSGINHFSYQQIRKYHDTEIYTYKWSWYLREWLTLQKSLNRKFFGKHTAVEFLSSYAKHFSAKLQADLKQRPVDLLFVTASPQLVAYLETDIPVIFMTDATFHQIQGYYPYFSNLAKYNIREGIELDRSAFKKATHLMLTSNWSRDSAVIDYGIDPGKISVVQLGPNLENIPTDEDIRHRETGPCRLLFLGVEWERKGGEIALQTFRLLRDKGLDTHLHIIGCVPPYDLSSEKDITIIPFLDKNKEEDLAVLSALLLRTDFLLLPTRAECSGVVFCEAAAFGFPSITTDTGGTMDYVKNGINGYTLDLQAGAEEYAEKIIRVIENPALQVNLRKSSRDSYKQKMNWETWGNEFNRIAHEVTRNPGKSADYPADKG